MTERRLDVDRLRRRKSGGENRVSDHRLDGSQHESLGLGIEDAVDEIGGRGLAVRSGDSD